MHAFLSLVAVSSPAARAEVVDPATAEERGGNQRGSQRGFA